MLRVLEDGDQDYQEAEEATGAREDSCETVECVAADEGYNGRAGVIFDGASMIGRGFRIVFEATGNKKKSFHGII